ncbi:MAG TPA: hypothetical protein VNX65_02455 [Patescibacteria group bacterium]|jgi:hypothetical protein|nr:hypothetical protein [Patescibacteria group bacterium]
MEYPINLGRYDPEMIANIAPEDVEKGGPGSGRKPGSHAGFKQGHVVSPKARAAASARMSERNRSPQSRARASERMRAVHQAARNAKG